MADRYDVEAIRAAHPITETVRDAGVVGVRDSVDHRAEERHGLGGGPPALAAGAPPLQVGLERDPREPLQDHPRRGAARGHRGAQC